ncbi:MAG: ATP-binding protein [Bacilli bacterium]
MTQLEFYKSFQFVIELIIAETLYAYTLKRRKMFIPRLVIGVGLTFLFSWLIPVAVNNAFYCAFMFLCIFAFTILVMKFLFEDTNLAIVFCGIAGYTTQHMTYEIFNLISIGLGLNADTPMGFYGTEFTNTFSNIFVLLIYLFVYLVIYFLCFAFFGDKLQKHKPIQLTRSFFFILVIIILVIDILLNSIVVYYFSSNTKPLYLIIVGIYNILCCLISIYLQFEVAIRKNLETTIDAMHQILHQRNEQYAISKETIALINMKCHDLKHQIRHLRSGDSISNEALADIEKSVNIYDSSVKTGNDALDTILTEKSLFCKKNQVRFSCIIDGEKLNFISEEDIYSLFGNIVDNAVEAVLKLEEDKRVISLTVRQVNDMLVIQERNYFDDQIRFENGMPISTKADKRYHGFGTKSISFLCDKYKGDLSFEIDDQIFKVTILFFIKEESAE